LEDVPSHSTKRWELVVGVIVLGALTGGCKDDAGEELGDVIARQTIGPEGGSIAGGGITLEVPVGALTAETELEIRTSKADLSVGDFKQSGGARAIFPDGLILRLPATLTYAGGPESPAVLFEQDGLTVAAIGTRAFVNELGTVAIAEAGTQLTTMIEPMLGPTLQDAGTPWRDTVHFKAALTESPRLNLALTIYDMSGAYEKPLNGAGEGDCGFKLENVLGGSLAAGCADGPLTATVRVTSAEVEFDVVPFLAGKLDTPVTVGVVGGNDDLAYQLGFFSFDTSPCFQETCSGRGTCEVQGDTAVCVCDDGYAANGLACDCVPQCAGRQCDPRPRLPTLLASAGSDGRGVD